MATYYLSFCDYGKCFKLFLVINRRYVFWHMEWNFRSSEKWFTVIPYRWKQNTLLQQCSCPQNHVFALIVVVQWSIKLASLLYKLSVLIMKRCFSFISFSSLHGAQPCFASTFWLFQNLIQAFPSVTIPRFLVTCWWRFCGFNSSSLGWALHELNITKLLPHWQRMWHSNHLYEFMIFFSCWRENQTYFSLELKLPVKFASYGCLKFLKTRE